MAEEGHRAVSHRGMAEESHRVATRRGMQAAVHRVANRRAMPVAGLKAVILKVAETGRRAAATAVTVAEDTEAAEAAVVVAEAAAVHRISIADRAHAQVAAACFSAIRVPPARQAAEEPETRPARRPPTASSPAPAWPLGRLTQRSTGPIGQPVCDTRRIKFAGLA
jgi:hypothetical protein